MSDCHWRCGAAVAPLLYKRTATQLRQLELGGASRVNSSLQPLKPKLPPIEISLFIGHPMIL
jgi:hypothetical protein